MASYIVITYNRCDLVLKCLTSIYADASKGYDVIVVDNASNDQTVTCVREKFPKARIIALDKNLGVAGARNVGIQASNSDYCLFIDDDAIVGTANLSDKVRDAFEADPKLAVISMRIETRDTGIEERSSIPRSDKKSQLESYDCAFFSGCGFALRRDVAVKVGMFWDWLFYSAEEIDFSCRVLAAGKRIVRRQDFLIRHYRTETARPSGQYFYYNARNRPVVALKNLPIIFFATQTIFWWLYLALSSLRNRAFKNFVAGLRDALRFLFGGTLQRGEAPWRTVQLLLRLKGRVLF